MRNKLKPRSVNMQNQRMCLLTNSPAPHGLLCLTVCSSHQMAVCGFVNLNEDYARLYQNGYDALEDCFGGFAHAPFKSLDLNEKKNENNSTKHEKNTTNNNHNNMFDNIKF